MSTRWLKKLEADIASLKTEKSAEIDALSRENADLKRRVTLLEQGRDPGDSPEKPRKAARIPSRPMLMQEMGIGVDAKKG